MTLGMYFHFRFEVIIFQADMELETLEILPSFLQYVLDLWFMKMVVWFSSNWLPGTVVNTSAQQIKHRYMKSWFSSLRASRSCSLGRTKEIAGFLSPEAFEQCSLFLLLPVLLTLWKSSVISIHVDIFKLLCTDVSK